MTVKLKLTHGDNYREFEFDRREVRLGRGPSNDLVIDDVRLSRVHGRIECDDGRARFTFEGGCTTRHTRDANVLDSARDEDAKFWMLEPGDILEIDGDERITLELLDVSTPRGPTFIRLEPAPLVDAPFARWLKKLSAGPTISAIVETLAEHYRGQAVRVVVSLHTEEDEFLNEVVASRADDDAEPSIYADPLRLMGPLGGELVDQWESDFFIAVTPSRSQATRIVAPLVWDNVVRGVVALEFDRELADEEIHSATATLAAFSPAARLALQSVANRRYAQSLAEENRYFRERERRHYHFKELICESPAMRSVYDMLNSSVDGDDPVLITGEAGTGKELMARALHHLGKRRHGMMITLNCGRLHDETLDYELFGCASTQLEGAVASRKGVFELAADGTVFLEEVDKLTPLMQGKLVRMLKEREVRRIGEAVGRSVRARVVTSIHRDLNELVQSGELRRDLYLLLKQNILEVPSLRQRREDVLPLARTFVKTYSDRYDAELKLSKEGSEALLEHDWPGNVRELQTRIEAAVLDCDGDTITEAHLGL